MVLGMLIIMAIEAWNLPAASKSRCRPAALVASSTKASAKNFFLCHYQISLHSISGRLLQGPLHAFRVQGNAYDMTLNLDRRCEPAMLHLLMSAGSTRVTVV